MNIHIHIGPADADLLRLSKYIPYGLGKLFKNAVMSYYTGEEFIQPPLKYMDKANIKDVKVYFSKKEIEAIAPLLDISFKSTLIKNLTRMKTADLLLSICKPVYRVPKKKEEKFDKPKKIERKPEIIETKKEVKIEKKDSKNEERKMPNLFVPKEY